MLSRESGHRWFVILGKYLQKSVFFQRIFLVVPEHTHYTFENRDLPHSAVFFSLRHTGFQISYAETVSAHLTVQRILTVTQLIIFA